MKKRFILVPVLLFAVLTSLTAQDEPGIHVSVQPTPLVTGSEGTVTARFSIPPSMHMALQEKFFYVRISGVPGIESGQIVYPEGIEEDGFIYYEGEVILTLPITVTADAVTGDYTATAEVGYQMCDTAGVCFMPQKESFSLPVTVSSATEGPARAGSSVPFLKLIQFVLLAFIGGIILNVMPCVLPLLSVRALSLVNQSRNERNKIFWGSMAYTGGILTSFIVFAVIVTVLKLSGELVGWGFQFQNPVFIIVLASLIFVFALSMFDVFVIQPPGTGAAAKAAGKGGHLGSYLTGIFAVLVATPCTAPFMGTALGFAFSQPPLIIFLIFIFIGLGLALPFIVLGIWPRFIQKIPKPGNWMNIFKEVMGFLLIGTVIYLLITLNRQLTSENFIRLLIFLGLLAFSSWLYGRFARPGTPRVQQWIIMASVVAVIVLGSVFVVKTETAAEGGELIAVEEVYINEEWEAFSPEKIEEYRKNGDPVFISFHAVWCTNCKVNKARVLSADVILDAFESYGVRLFHADFTNNDETIARWISDFGKAGVPVYALFVPGRDKAIVLPEILSRKMVLDALEENLQPAS